MKLTDVSQNDCYLLNRIQCALISAPLPLGSTFGEANDLADAYKAFADLVAQANVQHGPAKISSTAQVSGHTKVIGFKVGDGAVVQIKKGRGRPKKQA